MAGVVAETAAFRRLFESPSLEGVLHLDWSDFEDFIQYVFECAGYTVQKVSSRPQHNVDLILYTGPVGGKVRARVEVRRYTTANLIKAKVQQFHGAVMEKGNAPGYLITTTDFTRPAYQAAELTNGKVTLINGERLMRYVRYVHGSHLAREDMESASFHQGVISPNWILEAESIPRLDPTMTTVLSVANNKGGVAKTTTALNLAFALAEKRKYRVLLVDLDGQASLTNALLDSDSSPASTLLDHFTRGQQLHGVVHPTRFDRIWIIPADERLPRLDLSREHPQAAELKFVRAIHSHDLTDPDGEPFDWIILDTPPTQSFFTRIALAASHFVLLPATAETQAVFGVNRAIITSRTMKALMKDGVETVGGVITRWKKSVPAEQAVIGLVDILRRNQVRLFSHRIPEDGKIERAHQQTFGGKRINVFHIGRQQGPAADAYESLMKELLIYVNRA